MHNKYKLIMADLDGTLLGGDSELSERTIRAIEGCRERGMLFGIATARAELNARRIMGAIKPDISVLNNGAIVKRGNRLLCDRSFSAAETEVLICAGLELGVEVMVDSSTGSYWNCKINPFGTLADWQDIKYNDFSSFSDRAMSVYINLSDAGDANKTARQIASRVAGCVCHEFSGTGWFDFSSENALKEVGVADAARELAVSAKEIVAFGDDYPDVGMLMYCGLGVAMGNAIPEVKSAADDVAGYNFEDGLAEYLEKNFLS